MGDASSHPRAFSEQAFKLAAEPKALHIVADAGHLDLDERVNMIAWDRRGSSFKRHLT